MDSHGMSGMGPGAAHSHRPHAGAAPHPPLSTGDDPCRNNPMNASRGPTPIVTPVVSGPSADVPAQADVDDFLRRKRKVREHKACYPCRQRKVKCDLGRPCQTCIQRDHPEVCSYHPPSKRQSVASHNLLTTNHPTANDDESSVAAVKAEDTSPASSAAAATTVTLSRTEFDVLLRKLNTLEDSIAGLRRQMHVSPPSMVSASVAGGSSGLHSHRHSLTRPSTRPDHLPDAAQESDDDDDSYHRGERGGRDEYSPDQTPLAHQDLHGLPKRAKTADSTEDVNTNVPSLIYAIGQGEAAGDSQQAQQLNELLGKSVLPLFGLDNETATYPFVDLWGLPHGSLQRAHGLAKALPSDDMMLSLFKYYHDVAHLVFPGLADVRQLEADLTMFLIARATATSTGALNGITEVMIYGKSFRWLGILFAVLANGAQFSEKPRKDCELTASVYVCCAFECLRHCNFLAAPHIENVQALLIIGIVMTNNMNAAGGWTLLGLTSRIAQGLGLHEPCPPSTSREIAQKRSSVWWGIIWQDSILSITYDRSAAPLDVNALPMPQHFGHVSPYHASMYRICKVSLEIVRERANRLPPTAAAAAARHNCHTYHNPHEQIARITHYANEIALIIRDSAEYLRDSRKCSSPRESIEHFGLYLHTSYVMSELYRPAINPTTSDPQIVAAFRAVCIDNLVNTIEAYLGLTQVDIQRLSWAAIHRALGSALLLCILQEHCRNDRARDLINKFIASMQADAADPYKLSAPSLRGLDALGRLFDQRPGSSISATLPVSVTNVAAAQPHSTYPPRDDVALISASNSSSSTAPLYTPVPRPRAGPRFYDPTRPATSLSDAISPHSTSNNTNHHHHNNNPNPPPQSQYPSLAPSLDEYMRLPASSSSNHLPPHAYPRLQPLTHIPPPPPSSSNLSSVSPHPNTNNPTNNNNTLHSQYHPTPNPPPETPPPPSLSSTTTSTSFAPPGPPGSTAPGPSSFLPPSSTSAAAAASAANPFGPAGPTVLPAHPSDQDWTSPHAMLHTILWGRHGDAPGLSHGNGASAAMGMGMGMGIGMGKRPGDVPGPNGMGAGGGGVEGF